MSDDAWRRPHALIVSDDPGLAQFLGEGLVIGGFWTSVIASGLQTLEVFRLRTFDLAVIDSALSGLGAGELIRRLRRPRPGSPTADLPIVLIAEQHEAATARELLVDLVLTPPIDLEHLVPELFKVVRDWRSANPGRLWADEIAQVRPQDA